MLKRMLEIMMVAIIVAGAAGFPGAIGINTIEGCRDPVSLFITQPDVLMRTGQSRGKQKYGQEQRYYATMINHENPQYY